MKLLKVFSGHQAVLVHVGFRGPSDERRVMEIVDFASAEDMAVIDELPFAFR